MTKIIIAAVNLQSGVATTKSNFHYIFTTWKYWLPHSHRPITEAGKMLKKENVDIACITEISEKSLRTGFRSQTETLAHSAEMKHAHFFSSQKVGKFFFHEGNALLSKYQATNFASHLLYIELMNMALEEATIEIAGRKITVFIGHLALLKKNRDIQIREIIEIINNQEGPIILVGDFNARNGAELDVIVKETRLKHRRTLKTFPSWNGEYPLDNIFLSEEFTVLDCYIPEGIAFSDHAALIVKAELK
jgi:endonuclease/exonuclease/phosphatase family metal-dependent hydrolase